MNKNKSVGANMTCNQPVSLCRVYQSKWNILRKKVVSLVRGAGFMHRKCHMQHT